MLERTAATLESCTSLHALPSATRQLRSQRRLHTGFWQHGAAALDISSYLLAARCNATDQTISDSPPTPPETLAASTFLLDFLYPSGTASFLRRASPGHPHDHLASIRRLPRRSRPFTSSTVATSTKDSDSPEALSDGGLSMNRGDESAVRDLRYEYQQDVDPAEEDEFEEEEEEEEEEAEEEDDYDITSSHDTHSGPSYAGAGSRPELMRELMADKDTEYFGSIWQLYVQLEPDLQPEFRPEIIEYLYRSANIIDARRVVLLFSQIDDSQWTTLALTSVVTAYLRLGRESEALRLYHTALDEKAFVCGLDELLGHFFAQGDWENVSRVWASYHTVYLAEGINCGKLKQLGATPNLGALTMSFAEEVEAQEPEVARKLRILLNKAVRRAIQQPCKPDEALPLLKLIDKDQKKWFTIYLEEALARGQQEGLAEVYRVYRSFPNTRPYWRVLHGMFDIFYPEDVVGLEQVYEDYHTSYGGLDRWGYRKFLKYYASRGDIKSLERLWDNYVYAYQHRHVLREPETFNYIINAYANLKDYKSARRFFDEMRDKHGVTPGTDSWNQLLKSTTADYDLAKSVFEELCASVSPDKYSFATIMSVSAGEGDNVKTLQLLEQARSLGIEPDVIMLEKVIRAHSWYNRTRAMLQVCIDAHANNVPGDHDILWNALLRSQAHRRNLPAVARELESMAKHGVKWTSETHTQLLRALVRCGQTQTAYKLLRSAAREKSFKVVPAHIETIVQGALDGRHLALAGKLMKQLRQYKTMSVKGRIAQARIMIKQQLFAYSQNSKNVDGVEELMTYIRDLANQIFISAESERTVSSIRRADSLHRLRILLDMAIQLFGAYRDYDSVRELQQLHRSVTAATTNSTDNETPVQWLYYMMKEDVFNKRYEEAMAKWDQLQEKVLAIARPRSRAVMPRHRYRLSKPFETFIQICVELQSWTRLKRGFETLFDSGFLLERRAMNLVVQGLARTGAWLEACKMCEGYLMPRWTGWQQSRVRAQVTNNLPLETRRVHRSAQMLRPTSYTVILLSKEYHELRRAAMWSGGAARKLNIFHELCPRLVDAFNRMMYTGVGIEKELFGTQKSRMALSEMGKTPPRGGILSSQTEDSSQLPEPLSFITGDITIDGLRTQASSSMQTFPPREEGVDSPPESTSSAEQSEPLSVTTGGVTISGLRTRLLPSSRQTIPRPEEDIVDSQPETSSWAQQPEHSSSMTTGGVTIDGLRVPL
ncbi:pentatricopeptide repeat domain-containing protein [Colletotrichum salicis]|uniref:Pentatricopeptide repeat domain-containing protein n=1 Tax=Colletotrichum salicis TaxID=1209931 RepID=A0A135S465_9PEZI|nr:pentatricopeptide repeat domain-containing protein [Colletotrichum salicis]